MNLPAPQKFQDTPATSVDEAESLELVRYWRAINRRRMGIALFVIAVGVLASIYAFSLRPVYQGSATVLLDPIRKKVTNEEMYESFVGQTRDYYLTQIEVMKSREYAERLVRVLNLTRHPDFDPRQPKERWWGASFLDQLRPAALRSAPSEEEIVESVAAQVMANLTFQPVRNTQLVRVGFQSHDPALAERVPNTLAMIYIVADLEARGEASRRSWSFFAKEAADLKSKLAESERELQQYRESQKIVIAKGASLSDASRRLDDMTASLEEARKKRSEAEINFRQVSAAAQKPPIEALEYLAVLQRNPVLLRLQETEADAQRKFNDAAKRYGPEHPKMVSAQTDVKASQEAVRRQINTVVQAATKEYEVAKANEASIEQSFNRAKNDAQAYNRAEFPLARLERAVESNRRLYEAFMQRSKEAGIGDMREAIARVVDPAIIAKSPSGPNVRNIVAIAVLGALLFAIAVALLLERLDNKLRTSEDLELKLDVKAVGVLPLMKSTKGMMLERIMIDDNANTFSEAIRTVRSVVQLSGVDAPQKTILLTSTVPYEGKTTVASNLALAFSQVRKTLLIEADMRKPKLARLLGMDSKHAGLSEFVSGEMPIEQCIYPVNDSTLHLLHSGRVPLNPLEMLSSQRFAGAMQTLKQMYDVIVVDSPPAQLVSDAMVLSRFATAVLYVVRADDTPHPLVRSNIARLRHIHAPILGAVLNYFDVDRALKYYRDYGGMEAHYYLGYGYVDTPTSGRSGSTKSGQKGKRVKTPVVG